MKRRWKIAIGVVGGLIVLLVLNAIVVNGQTKDAKVNVDGGKIVQAFGGNVQVTDSGLKTGSPIVLIHCYTCSLRWWDGMLPLLEKDHRVIRVDLLGHGGSEKPAAGYSMENQAETVASVLAQLGVQHATVVGHSLGFTVATALAQKSPELVSRLVDIDQAPNNNDYGDNLPFLASSATVSLLGRRCGEPPPTSRSGTPSRWPSRPASTSRAASRTPTSRSTTFQAMTYKSYSHSRDAEIDYTNQKSLNDRLQPLGKPLLVIFGAEDQLYDATKAANAYSTVPGAQIQIIQGAGHSPNVEKPTETANLILEFAATPNNPAATPAKPEFKPPNKQKRQNKGKQAKKKASAQKP